MEKEKSGKNAAQFCLVTHTGLFSNQLVLEFKKLYQLRDEIDVPLIPLFKDKKTKREIAEIVTKLRI